MDVELRVLLTDMVQAAGALEVGIDHQHLLFRPLQGAEQITHHLAEIVADLAGLTAAAEIGAGILGRSLVLEHRHRLGQAALAQIGDGQIDGDDVVPFGGTLDAGNAHRHGPLVDHRHRPGREQRLADAPVEGLEVLAVADADGQTLPGQGAGDIEALHIGAGVAGDGDVVVVDEQLDREPAGHGIAGRLGVVALHLRAVAAEHHHRLGAVGLGDAVDIAPQVAEAARGEEHPVPLVALGVAVEAMAELAVVQQPLRRLVAVEHRHGVLDGDAVAGLVEVHRVHRAGALHEAIDDEHLGDDIIGAAGVPAEPLDVGQRGEEDQAVAHQADVVGEQAQPLLAQPLLVEDEGQGHIFFQIYRKNHLNLPTVSVRSWKNPPAAMDATRRPAFVAAARRVGRVANNDRERQAAPIWCRKSCPRRHPARE